MYYFKREVNGVEIMSKISTKNQDNIQSIAQAMSGYEGIEKFTLKVNGKEHKIQLKSRQNKLSGTHIYVDGAYDMKETGAYSVCIFDETSLSQSSKRIKTSKSTDAELQAIAEACKWIDKLGIKNATIHSDQLHLMKSLELGVNTPYSKKHPTIFAYIRLIVAEYDVKLNWVRSHSNNPMHNYAHRVAKQALTQKSTSGHLCMMIV